MAGIVRTNNKGVSLSSQSIDFSLRAQSERVKSTVGIMASKKPEATLSSHRGPHLSPNTLGFQEAFVKSLNGPSPPFEQEFA